MNYALQQNGFLVTTGYCEKYSLKETPFPQEVKFSKKNLD